MEQITPTDFEAWQHDWDLIIAPRKWNDRELMNAIREFLGIPDSALADQSLECHSGVVLLAAYHRGTDVAMLAEPTGYPADYVQQIADRMHKSGIWKGDRTDYPNWERGLPAFALDTLVADGEFVRLNRKTRTVVYVYQAVPGLSDWAASHDSECQARIEAERSD